MKINLRFLAIFERKLRVVFVCVLPPMAWQKLGVCEALLQRLFFRIYV